MTIVLVGGGSGGHITPILAVAEQLKKIEPNIKLIYIGQKGDKFADLPASSPFIDKVYSISAGKFRRYHGEGIKQLLDAPTTFKNARDMIRVKVGFVQSMSLLAKIKPDAVFIKGGFVGLPVGLAAAMKHIPYMTHDSDAIPGLANRLIAKWASVHAVAMPAELYKYPKEKIKYVGVPITALYTKLSADLVSSYRKKLGLDKYDKVILVTGGGLGALRLNNGVQLISRDLLEEYPDLAIVHVSGSTQEKDVEQYYDSNLPSELRTRVKVLGFTTELHAYSAVADVVISRAGATHMAEMAAQSKACVVVPNPNLTGGHQTKNASYLADAGAIRLVTEDQIAKDPSILRFVVKELLDNKNSRHDLGLKLHSFNMPNAAVDLAEILLKVSKNEI